MKKSMTILLLASMLLNAACAPRSLQVGGSWDSMKYSENSAMYTDNVPD